MSTGVALGISIVLLVLNAYFVAAEFALTGSRSSRIEPMVEEHNSARKVLWAIEHLSQMLAAAQLGVTLCSVGLGVLAEPAIAHLIEVPLELVGIPQAGVHAIAFLLALLLVVGLHVVLGEMVPKNVSVTHPERAALVLVPSLMVFGKVFHPVIVVLNWCSQLVLRMFGIEPRDEVISAFTADEVASIVQASEAAGVLHDEHGLISGALEFSDHVARDVMVPAGDVAGVSVDVTPAQVEQAVAATGFSRFLVRDKVGTTHGYVHMKDILGASQIQRDQVIPAWKIRPLVVVEPDDEVESVLREMRAAKAHMAGVVVDSQIMGIVFLEDVLEELIGEVRDRMQREQRDR